MKHLWILFLVQICLITFSCNQTPIEKLEVIKTYNTKELSPKTLIDKVDFVKLETSADNLISSVSKVLFTDSLIIIIDKDKAKAIFVFDKNGRYLRKIGTFGGGPTEYGPICDVTLSYDKNKIHVLCFRRLLTYDLNGKFLKSQKTKSIIHLIEYVDKDNFATFNYGGLFNKKKQGNLNLLQVVDKDFDNVIYSGVKSSYKANEIKITHEVPLVNLNEKVFVMPELSDTIYQVTVKNVIPRYYIKTEKTKPNTNEVISSSKKGNINLSSRFNGKFYQLDDYVIIDMIFSHRPLIFYNTKSKKAYSYDAYKVKETHPLLLFTNDIKTQYKSALVTVVSPSNILSRKNLFYKSYDRKIIDNLLENLTEDDNPVLLFYHVNKYLPQ